MPKVYDVKKVTTVVSGSTVTGVAEGEYLTAELAEDGFVPYTGADGQTDVAISHDKKINVTLRLKSTSPFVSTLNALANEKAIFGMSHVDGNENGITVNGTRAVVMKSVQPPSGKEISEAEFNILILDGSIG